MKDFTAIYLLGLQQGITKRASLMDFRPFEPGNAPITGGVAGAALGGVVGGVGNAIMGSSREDPKTGKRSNGVLARLMKGGVVGAAGGAVAGAMAGPTVNDAASKMMTESNSPLHTGVAQSLTVSDLLNEAMGNSPSAGRQVGLGVEGLIRGGRAAADNIIPQ